MKAGRRYKEQERPSFLKADIICLHLLGGTDSQWWFFLFYSMLWGPQSKLASLASYFWSHFQPLQPMITSSFLLLRAQFLWYEPFPTAPRPDPSHRFSWLTRTLWPPFPSPATVHEQCSLNNSLDSFNVFLGWILWATFLFLLLGILPKFILS